MTYTQKRKIIRIAVAAVVTGIMATIAVLWSLNRTTYADFRTMQCQLTDLELFGESPAAGSGLYREATWVGEGYACTVEQHGKTGECISIPYVEWVMYDTRADTNRGEGEFRFCIAERMVMDGKIRTGGSPYRYSNVTLTLIVGEQTSIRGCRALGSFFNGRYPVDEGDKILLDVAVLDKGEYRTPEEAEATMNQAWQAYEFALNRTIFYTDVSAPQGVQLRLPEKRNGTSPWYHLGGRNAEHRAVFGVNCEMDYINRLNSDQQKFPQTAYFKVTYDVENTVTGERTTESTGWISQNYTAYGLSNSNQ